MTLTTDPSGPCSRALRTARAELARPVEAMLRDRRGRCRSARDGEELQPLTIGVIPIAPSAPVQPALDEGIFAEHGLDVTLEAAQDGGNPDEVEFVETSFQDMPAQLERGEIDAARVPEPFLTQLINGEQTELVGRDYQDTVPGLDTMVTFSGETFAEENPEVLESYEAAMEGALQFAEENPDRVRETIVSFLDMPDEVIQAG